MATIISNDFTSWDLNIDEALAGSLLNQMQKQVIQNDLAIAAQQLLNEEFDPANPLAFARQQAFLQATIRTYRFILDRSSTAEETLRKLEQVRR